MFIPEHCAAKTAKRTEEVGVFGKTKRHQAFLRKETSIRFEMLKTDNICLNRIVPAYIMQAIPKQDVPFVYYNTSERSMNVGYPPDNIVSEEDVDIDNLKVVKNLIDRFRVSMGLKPKFA